MTWETYNATTRVENDWSMTMTICHGVYEHPHFSNEMIVDAHGVKFDWSIHWIVGDMCDDSKVPHGKTRMDVLKHIIEHGADVNQLTHHVDFTPLMETIDGEVFGYLLSKGANVNKRCCGKINILHERIDSVQASTIEAIWHFPGVSGLAHEKDNRGQTPLDCMIQYQRKTYPRIVEFLSN